MQYLDLAYEEYGHNNLEVLVILHGFFASSRNWRKISELLSAKYHVFALDLRNHGGSPHAPTMDYPAMVGDVLRFINKHALNRPHILGHSMGGKVAMWLALNYPEQLGRLVIADIAPKSYQHSFDAIIAALQALPLAEITNRKQAEGLLAEAIPKLDYRQFLLQNAVLVEGAYQWRIDLSIFQRESHHITAFPEVTGQQPYCAPTLFLVGEHSDFVNYSDTLVLFPNAEYKIIEGASHWLHVQKPEVFAEEVGNFLERRR